MLNRKVQQPRKHAPSALQARLAARSKTLRHQTNIRTSAFRLVRVRRNKPRLPLEISLIEPIRFFQLTHFDTSRRNDSWALPGTTAAWLGMSSMPMRQCPCVSAHVSLPCVSGLSWVYLHLLQGSGPPSSRLVAVIALTSPLKKPTADAQDGPPERMRLRMTDGKTITQQTLEIWKSAE